MDYQIIAVDFDGTLCYSNWPELGEPNLPLIEYLKKEGVWDNTKIIFVSDHGFTYETGNYDNSNLPFMIDDYTAFLMVKDFNAIEPLRIDNTFMTNADTPAIALEDIVENPKNPFTGNPLEIVNKQNYLKIAIPNSESTRKVLLLSHDLN